MSCNTPGTPATVSNTASVGKEGIEVDPNKPYYDVQDYDDETFQAFTTHIHTHIHIHDAINTSAVDKPAAADLWDEFFHSYGGEESCLARFLTAREGHVEKACEMMTTSFNFRREHDVSGIILPDNIERLAVLKKIREYWTATFFGVTSDGSPIQYHRVELLRPAVLMKSGEDDIGGEERMRTFYLWWMETSLSLQRVGHEKYCNSEGPMPQGIEIFDLKNVSWWRMSSALGGLKMFSRALSVGQDHYPEILRKAFVLNAPATVTILWTVVLWVLSARTKAKISITRGENRLGLSEYMDEETIDLMFGCAQCFEHEQVEERKREIERFEEEDEEENNEMKGGEDTSLEEQKKDGNRSEMSMQTLEDHFVEQNMVLSVHIEDVEVDSDGHKTLSI
jgi:hypothetical protein